MGSSARDRADAEARRILGAKAQAESQARAQKQAEQDAPPDFVPQSTRSSLVVGNAPTSTVRSRLEQQALVEHPEVLTPPSRSGGGSGAFTTTNAPLTQREKAERQRTLAEIANTPENLRTAAAQFYLDAHAEEVAQQERWAREKAEEQARISAANAQRERENARLIGIKLALTQVNASEAERARIWKLIANRPEVTDEKVIQMIYIMRDELAGSRPEWAGKL